MQRHAEEGITTHGLVTGYDGKPVVSDVNIVIPKGEVTCILGRSGCGKSTVMRTILLLQPPLAGDIRFDGRSIIDARKRQIDELRRDIGVLFQGAALFNSMTLVENVAFPILERTGADEQLAEELALLKLDLVGLAKFARYLPAAVSGGMRKRCGIARALALDPPYLFLDEPSAGLDPVTSLEIDRLILEIRDELGTTVLVVTHELESIRIIANRVIMIDQGRVVAEGTLDEVERAGHPAVRSFFGRALPASAGAGEGGLEDLILP